MSSEEPKKKQNRKTLPIEEFFRQAKKGEKAVILRPHEFIKSSTGNYCKLTEKHVCIAKEMAELGCSDKDIRNKLGLRVATYWKYLNQGKVIEEYLKALGAEPEEDEWQNLLPHTIDLEDETGERARIYQTHLKYRFYRGVIDGRVDGNMSDLKAIREAGDKDWKAKAWVLSRRSPEYAKEEKKDDLPKIMVQNNNLFQTIEQTARQLEEQDRQKGLLPDTSSDDCVDAEYEKYIKGRDGN